MHKDSVAGVKFDIPFAGDTVYGQDEMRRIVERAHKVTPPPGIEYTSGVYSKRGVPYIGVWTQANVRPVSREHRRVLRLRHAPHRLPGVRRDRRDGNVD